ncbi:MAG TPA: hypothetical protein VJ754_08315 [Anaerolineae bacterium]|nr:hypothetical protein [Anaerolineae bacterium]
MSNPFISGPPIQDPENFYGRREAIARIFAMLAGPQIQSLMLLGLRLAGKTSLMNYVSHPRLLASKLPRPEDHVVAYVNLEAGVRTPADFYNLLARRILETAKQLPSMYSAILSVNTLNDYNLSMIERLIEVVNRKVTILLDEFEVLTGNPAFSVEFFNGMRSLIARFPVAWITASYRNLYQLGYETRVQSSPFFNVFNQSIYVGAMSGDEPQELITRPAQRVGRPFAPEDAAWIEQTAGGLPCFIQKAAMLLYEARDHHSDNQAAARESMRRAFSQWADHHYHYYWQHFTEDEREALAEIVAGRDASLATYRAERGTDAVDALVSYGILAETEHGYLIRGRALEHWIAAKSRPVRSISAAHASVRLNASPRSTGSLKLEAAQVAVLAKAIDLLFEQGRTILQERRTRRPDVPDVYLAPDSVRPMPDLSKAEALRLPVRMSAWSSREPEVKHLVSLLEIQARNYFLAKEQLARWGNCSVPPVVLTNLEEAENSVADTAARLNAIIADLYHSASQPADAVLA